MPAAIVPAAISAAGSIAGGIAGQQAGAGARGEANNAQNIANQILQELQAAPDISKPLILERYRQAGVLTPQMEQYISAGPSTAESLKSDTQALDAQRNALKQMQERSTKGLTEGDRAALAEARLATQGDVESKRQQIMQQMQARGLGGSGAELASQLLASQAGANRQSHDANQIAQQAAQQALQATALTGQMGNQLEGQQFNQGLQKSQAADIMKRFNIENQIANQQRNVGSSNEAQRANLSNLQGINNLNTSGQNQELNNQLQRQMDQYAANTRTAQIKSGGMGNLANELQQRGQQESQGAFNTYSGLGQTLGGLAGAIGSLGGGSNPLTGATQQAGTGISAVKSGIYDNTKGLLALGRWEGGQVEDYRQGGQVHDYKQGGMVPGQAKVPGDSPINDTVKAHLSPGEIVVPRSLAESKIGKELVKLIHAHNSVKNKLNGSD